MQVLSDECSSPAKDTTGAVEAIRNLHLVRGSEVKSRAAALVQPRDILIITPATFRERLDAKRLQAKATQVRELLPDLSRLDKLE
jgi:transposase